MIVGVNSHDFFFFLFKYPHPSLDPVILRKIHGSDKYDDMKIFLETRIQFPVKYVCS